MNFTFLLFTLYVLTSDKKDEKTIGLLKTDLNPLTGEVLEREMEDFQKKTNEGGTDGAQNNEFFDVENADLDSNIARAKKASDKELQSMLETLLIEKPIDEEPLSSKIIQVKVYHLNSNETIDGTKEATASIEVDINSKPNGGVTLHENYTKGNKTRLNASSVVVVHLSTIPKDNISVKNKTNIQDKIERLSLPNDHFDVHVSDFGKLLSEVGTIVEEENEATTLNSVKEAEQFD